MCAVPEEEESILTYVLSCDLTDALKNSIIFSKVTDLGVSKPFLYSRGGC